MYSLEKLYLLPKRNTNTLSTLFMYFYNTKINESPPFKMTKL